MANKYHVNKETGRANICRATGKRGCPLGDDTPHFNTKEEAKSYIEKSEAESNDTFTTMRKNNNKNKNETVGTSLMDMPYMGKSNIRGAASDGGVQTMADVNREMVKGFAPWELAEFNKYDKGKQEVILDFMREEHVNFEIAADMLNG